MQRVLRLLAKSALELLQPCTAVAVGWQAGNVQMPEVIRPSFVFAGQRRQPQGFLNRKRKPMYGSAGIDGELRAPYMAVISVSRLPGGPGSHKALFIERPQRHGHRRLRRKVGHIIRL